MKLVGKLFFLAGLSAFSSAFAAEIPECPAYGRPLEVNNQQVLHWKRTTENQFRERGNVKGNIVRLFQDRSGHEHFEIQIGRDDRSDTVEIIYNQDFGKLPERLDIGAEVQACGDYITSNAPSGPYPASPSGALIHWVHMNPSGRGHDPGFLVIDGELFGMDAENAGPPPRRRTPPRRPNHPPAR